MLTGYLEHITVFTLVNTAIILLAIPWVLLTKKDSNAALAWCLVVVLVPVVGVMLFWVFGYNHVYRPLRRKQKHRESFEESHPPRTMEAVRGKAEEVLADSTFGHLGELALRVNAFPISPGNRVVLYHDTASAFEALINAIAEARHHIHLEFFIFRPDATGKQVIDLLTRKVTEGVEVRLLYDSMGGRHLGKRFLAPLIAAGGRVSAFFPLNPLQSRFRINLRNHRKVVVTDGRIGFTGGMNIGDEYLGKSRRFGYWRDGLLRLEGPAVAGLQRVFTEDWDFAVAEPLDEPAYFPELSPVGDALVQVIESGPDQEINSIREIFFAAILAARERLWIATPYFVPDSGIIDALRLASYRGVDVRLLLQLKPDQYLAYFASRYYWADMLAAGVKIYQYAKGMLHSKLMMVDGQWGMAGSANLDNRSLHLNFEVGAILHAPALVGELENRFAEDLRDSVQIDPQTFAHRSFPARLAEHACRLLSPLL